MSWWDRVRAWLDAQPSEPPLPATPPAEVPRDRLLFEIIRLQADKQQLEHDLVVRLEQVNALARELETCSIERARLRELLARTPFIRPPPT